MKHIILLIIGALLISNSIAQEDKKKDRRSEKMEMMTVWKLTEHLKLTEEQGEKFFPRFRGHREELEKIHQEQRQLMKTLQEKIERGDEIKDNEINSQVDNLAELEKRKLEFQKKYILDLEGVLNNAQRAKLIGFERRLRQEVKDQMKEHRKEKKRSHEKRGRKKGFWNEPGVLHQEKDYSLNSFSSLGSMTNLQ